MAKNYLYFISYKHETGYGNLEVIRDFPIRNMSDINDIQHSIVKAVQQREGNVLKDVCVTHFQLFDNE